MSSYVRTPCDEAIIRTGEARPDAPPATASAGATISPARGRWVLVATVLGSSMAFVDGTVVNVALPVLQHELGASVADAQWVVESYAVVLAGLILAGGALGDRYGRRRVFGAGIVLFTAASILCGLAPSVDALIAARAVQGIGAALLVPGSLAILSAAFPAAERGRAIGTWSAFTAIAAGFGPVVGGWLIGAFSWRWIFFLNVPFAIVVLVLLATHVPESRNPAAKRLDVTGSVLATAGLCGLVFGLIEAESVGFTGLAVWLSLIGGAAASVAFLAIEARAREPMMPLSLFRSRNFAATNGLTLLLYAALSGALFFVPFVLIQVHGYSPAGAGAALMPIIALLFVLSPRAGALAARIGPRLPLTVGPAIAAAAFILFALPDTGGSYWTTFFPAALVLGLGLGITVAPLTSTVMSSVDDDHAGIASGINNAVSRTAGVVAIAVLGLVVLARFQHSLARGLDAIGLDAGTRAAIQARSIDLAALRPPASLAPERAAQVEHAVQVAFIAGFRQAMIVAAALALASALIAALAVRNAGGPRKSGPPSASSRAENA